MARGIQAEIKQAKPFSSLEEEALISLQRTADQLQWRISELLKPYGISPTQYNALRILRGAKGRGHSCSQIAKRMINRDPDNTRLVDRSQRRGFACNCRDCFSCPRRAEIVRIRISRSRWHAGRNGYSRARGLGGDSDARRISGRDCAHSWRRHTLGSCADCDRHDGGRSSGSPQEWFLQSERI